MASRSHPDDPAIPPSGGGPGDASAKPGASGAFGASGGPGELFDELQRELRQLAKSALARERRDHTLQPTALLNELWLRVANNDRLAFGSRSAFLAFAAGAVRNILVDHARKRLADKRGGARTKAELDHSEPELDDWAQSMVDLEDELSRLTEMHPRSARVVELRFFGGLEMREIASHLGVSERTVGNDWATAKAWLRVRLDTESAG